MLRRSVLGSVVGVVVAGCAGGSGSSGGSPGTGSVPEIVERSFRVRGASCGSRGGESAVVSFEESAVRVRGSVVGANGCYRARLASASYEEDADVCRVVVESFDAGGPGEVCTQCVTVVEYVAAVAFAGELPGRVEVVHDDLGGRSVVASASRP